MDPVFFGALVDYYGNAVRCNWSRSYRRNIINGRDLWRKLKEETEANKNPYHLVVALYAQNTYPTPIRCPVRLPAKSLQ